VLNDHIHVFVEPSESSPYPKILEIRHADVLLYPEPIAVYAVCPVVMTEGGDNRTAMKRLQDHGYGLITVDSNGHANRVLIATPLIQLISKAEYNAEISTLPISIKRRVHQAFEDYSNKPSMGVAALTEVIEGLVAGAGRDALRAGKLTKADLNSTALTLDALHNAYRNARAAIGGVRVHVAEYRNPSHHWPANKKKACTKYKECRHAFLDGLKKMKLFRISMMNEGLSGKLAKIA
jgi:hypothetical protein